MEKDAVYNWVITDSDQTKVTKTKKQNKNDLKRNQSLNSFFDSLPTMESHYCRASITKKYLLPDWGSKTKLFDLYVTEWSKLQNTQHLYFTEFNEVFKNKNLGLFTPKKDQRELCVRYSV